MKKSIGMLLVVSIASVLPALADTTKAQDEDRMQAATEILQSMTHMPDKGIPDRLLKSARCLAIIPGEKKVAFFVGGSYGKGVAVCRDQNGWSAPLFITMGGGSFGFQWGATSTDFVLLFRGREGLEKQLSDKFQIGASAAGAAGPVGRDAAADTDITLRAEVLTYSRTKGLFAGVDLKGAVMQPDDSGNRAMYGPNLPPYVAILTGRVHSPTPARAFDRELAAVAGRGMAAQAARR